MRPGHGSLRLARTLLLALSSVGLSAAAHAGAGGCVTAVGVVTASVVLGAATWTQLSRERSARFLLGWLAVGQLLGHGLLEIFCRGAAHRSEVASVRMVVLHTAAVGLTALLLSVGERRIWTVARLLAALWTWLCSVRVHLLRARISLPPAHRSPVLVAVSLWCSSLWCSARPVRRGPPRLVPATA